MKIRRLPLLFLLVISLLLSGCGQPAAPKEQDPEEFKRPNTIENYELKLFLQDLDEQSRENIFAMYHAIMHFEKTCYLPYPMPYEQVRKLLTLLTHECAELFQIDLSQPTSYHNYEGDPAVIALDFPYCMDQATYQDLLFQVRQALLQLPDQGLSLGETVRGLYDHLGQRLHYTTETTHCGNAYGALVEGKAKCDGIAMAMKWAMEAAGYSCACISGIPLDSPVGHAWNLFRLGGQYYHLDLTADVPSQGDYQPMYPAYLVSTDFMLSSYQLGDSFHLPAEQDMSKSYYGQNGGLIPAGADWSGQVKDLFLDGLEEGSTFTLQFETAADFTACKNGLEELFREAAREEAILHWSWSTTSVDRYRLLRIHVEE